MPVFTCTDTVCLEMGDTFSSWVILAPLAQVGTQTDLQVCVLRRDVTRVEGRGAHQTLQTQGNLTGKTDPLNIWL